MLKWLSNKYVFNLRLKVWTLWDLLILTGSLFQSLDAAVQNALSPRDVNFVFETINATDLDKNTHF